MTYKKKTMGHDLGTRARAGPCSADDYEDIQATSASAGRTAIRRSASGHGLRTARGADPRVRR